MDCQTFDASLIDALYGELDAVASAELDGHAASCAMCGPRAAALRKTRELVREGLDEVPVPEGLEAKILAAASTAEQQGPAPTAGAQAVASNVVDLAARRWYARPELAVAAGFLLLVGAGAVLFQSKKSEPAMASAPAARGEQAPGEPPAAMPVTAPPVATAAASAVALGAAQGDALRAKDPAFLHARTLHDEGKWAEALPLFEALAAKDPDADLYAARCVSHMRGCTAATPRFDTMAKRHPGTEAASRASLEAARCVTNEGHVAAARARYQPLKTDNYVAAEANADLAALDTPVHAAKPAAAAPAPPRPAKPVATPASPRMPARY